MKILKKYRSIRMTTYALLLASAMVCGSLSAADPISPYQTCELADPAPQQVGYSTIQLQPSMVYYVNKNTMIGNPIMRPRTLEVMDTAIIHINRNCTLMVNGYMDHAAIRVPDRKVLIISGDEGSTLIAVGGVPTSGATGSVGGDGSSNACSTSSNDGGCGGQGGQGGTGGGAGIGGNGGLGGKGGPGAPKNVCEHNENERSGDDGLGGLRGQEGESMGVVYVVGDVRVQAIPGHTAQENLEQAAKGSREMSGGTFWYHVYCSGGGGGGTGATGALGDGIGSGGPGGGGGGGGGAGSVINSSGWGGDKKYYADGQGGMGGIGDFGGASGKQGLPGHAGESCGYVGGNGGAGGRTGEKGSVGNLFARDQENAFVNFADLGRSVSPIDPSMKVMRMQLRYTGVDTTAYRPFRFYYGMPMSQTILVPARTEEDVFGGFYYNDTQIYDREGHLTPEGEHLLYTYNNVTLTARWVGPAQVHIALRFEDPNPGLTGLDTLVFHFDSIIPLSGPEDEQRFVFRAEDYCPKGYSVKTDLLIDSMVHLGELITGVARYELIECVMKWMVWYDQDEASHHVSFRDWDGNRMTAFTYPRYWQVVTPPELVYDSDIWRLRTRIVRWDGMPLVMDSQMAGAYLHVAMLRHGIFVNRTSEAGGSVEILGEDNQQADSCYYAQPMRIVLHPEVGYRAIAPEVNQWIGDALGAPVAVTQENDTIYTFLGDSTDIVVRPRFELLDYHLHMDYTVVGQAPADPTACTYVTTSADNYQTILPVDEAVYHNQEYVSMASWYCQDEVYDWIGVPTVVNRQTGDTIEAQLSVETIVSDDDAYYLCYTFLAPASDVDVHMKMYYRPQHDCRIFDDKQDETIDSVMVNLNTVVLPKDSTIRIRPMDILTLCVSADTSAVRAGYWDEEGAFHRMSVRADAELSPSGEYNMYYYSVIAPDAPMTMGVVDGLRIRLVHCDSLVQWIAPGVAIEGDTVVYTVKARQMTDIVEMDSVLIYDLNSHLIYRAIGNESWGGRFVMPAQQVLVYVYAHRVGERVPYVDKDGIIKYVENPTPIVTCTEEHVALDRGWYVVRDADVRIAGARTYGEVHIILADGASLTSVVPENWNEPGIEISRDYPLTIYGQVAQTGRLTACGAELHAGIGSESSGGRMDLTINGGIITAIGGNLAAGIGGLVRTPVSHITINRGIVTAISGDMETSGIGSGHRGSPSTDIYVADSLFVRAGQNAATEKIEHTSSTDIAAALHGLRYVTIRPAYHRSTKSGTYGTICLPYGSTDLTGAGAVFYEVSGANRTEDGTLRSIALDTVAALEGGYSYVYHATDDHLTVECVGDKVSEPVPANGMIGKLSAETERFWGGENIYILGTDNKIHHVADTVSINFVQNRAYFDLTDVPPTSTDPTPGRLVMGVVGGDSGITTYLEETPLSQPDQARKMFIQGRIVILRGNRFYTLDGREL